MAESYRVFFASPRPMRLMGPDETRVALDDHCAIADAITRRGGEAAEQIARRHLRTAYARSIKPARDEDPRRD